ncbi:MAG: bifunctional diaminohydroxyphosphoribosylaminopyrimidine deaminase/5-amino-6-(5-phosphoribosylamino)uracil reductase RibD [Bacteroidetes bacterium]|nr:bifunctional diaminohydroxyphosphoribosylaminopyrimidine deaminase/5-amino-6-(5-phosphoribosylamino)uracil reductase RibD [Bacteroidota bacterium]
MQRCLDLAHAGIGSVSPNPMVGAVLVYNDRIIGEGYHEKYGGPHAEVNCLNSVKEQNRAFIQYSRLYVSLEPCAHFGKTPPCAQLIIQENIPEVIVGCEDPYKEVSGKGIALLKQAGIKVTYPFLENECREINKRFFTFHEKKRPFIILKWAQSMDGKIAALGNKRTFISNTFTNKLVHRWRSEEAAILIGSNTALKDNPHLTTRAWPGKNPNRIVIDNALKVPSDANVYNGEAPTIIFNLIKNFQNNSVSGIRIHEESFLEQLLQELYLRGVQSVLVEGGAKTIQLFINSGLWDEARIITNTKMVIGEGVAAPIPEKFILVSQENIDEDLISYYKKITESTATI